MNQRAVFSLRRAWRASLRRPRLLPVNGKVLVEMGQQVAATELIAEAEQLGQTQAVNVASSLGIAPEEVPGVMLKQPGQSLLAGEIMARTRGVFGLGGATLRAPSAGELTEVSTRTGLALIQSEPRRLSVRAHLAGEIVEIMPQRGAVIGCECTHLQGIFGVGGEQIGQLALCGQGPAAELKSADLDPQLKGRVVVGGALITSDVLHHARQLGVAALVTGGIHAADLEAFLGYDVHVAVTGHEDVGLTLIITGGFGRVPLDPALYRLLAAREGALASVCGATQVRAGAVRPEILIPWLPAAAGVSPPPMPAGETAGTVRIVCEPYQGVLAEVIEWPPQPRRMPSGVRAAAVVLRLADGRELCLPRANIELLVDED